MINLLRSALFWTTLLIVTVILFGFLTIVVAYHKLFSPEKTSHGAHWVAILWGKSLVALTPGWTSSVHGRQNLPSATESPVVIVANHQSAADIWALYLTGAQFRWLSKEEVFRLPLIGPAMKWAGYVPIKRGLKSSHAQAMRTSVEWIQRGVNMVFFPEGTRSEDGKLKEFKTGAFRLAMDSNVAVLPVVIRGAKNMMAKHSASPKPAHLEIDILPKEYVLEGESAEAFATRVQAIIGRRLEQSLIHEKKDIPNPSVSVPT